MELCNSQLLWQSFDKVSPTTPIGPIDNPHLCTNCINLHKSIHFGSYLVGINPLVFIVDVVFSEKKTFFCCIHLSLSLSLFQYLCLSVCHSKCFIVVTMMAELCRDWTPGLQLHWQPTNFGYHHYHICFAWSASFGVCSESSGWCHYVHT